ncbi:hypothetical protein AWR36_004170 [Microbulbifer flavimaris]|uniref:Amidohydrolase-related domain-containing protein n=1 Tax=Microbulbifer flavimaris TaxID=1781068 RepID=A0ABX4I3E4_9GAMM|nr:MULTISPECIES: amidohydrolase family protein [Microbulbifer]KUJ84841.1 hypothetical protein AVO43_04170 [Microbulbifer sp. ZGT114]PCO06939.1 hypothetical protein AWR36_004170 [Microbulbifer flavimaris]
MRIALGLFAVLFSGIATAAPTSLVNATVYDGTGQSVIKNGVITVDQGKIRCIGPDCKIPEDAEVIDIEGKYITPGLVDAHVHYAATGSFNTRSQDSERYDLEQIQRDLKENHWRWDRAYLCSGVTAVLDPGSFSWTLDLQQPSETSTDRPHFVGAGPLITHTRSEASRFVLEHQKALGTSEFLPMDSDKAALAAVDKLAAMGARAVKIWFIKPEPGYVDTLYQRMQLVGKRVAEHNLPLLVHAQYLEGAKAAIRAGASVLVHSVGHADVDEEFLQLARDNDVIYQPTMGWARGGAAEGQARLFFGEPPVFDDPNNCIDDTTRQLVRQEFEQLHPLEKEKHSFKDTIGWLIHIGEDLEVHADNLKKVHEYGIKVATATDAGNPLVFHGPSIYAEMESMEAAGIPPEDVIVMSTRNGAIAMGELDRFGTLEAGKNADLVILNEDPGESTKAFRSITHVMRLGKLHNVSELAGAKEAPDA